MGWSGHLVWLADNANDFFLPFLSHLLIAEYFPEMKRLELSKDVLSIHVRDSDLHYVCVSQTLFHKDPSSDQHLEDYDNYEEEDGEESYSNGIKACKTNIHVLWNTQYLGLTWIIVA